MTQQIAPRRRVGDTLTPVFSALTQRDNDGVIGVYDLTGKTVKLKVINSADGSTKVAATSTGVTIESPATDGKVKYDFSSNGCNEPGIFWGSWISDASGETDTGPPEMNGFVILIDSDTKTAEQAYEETRANANKSGGTITVTDKKTLFFGGFLQFSRADTGTFTFTSNAADLVPDLSAVDTKVFLGIKDAAGRQWASIEGTVVTPTGLQSMSFTPTAAQALAVPKGTHFFVIAAVYGYDSSLTPPYASLRTFASGRVVVTDIYLNPAEL